MSTAAAEASFVGRSRGRRTSVVFTLAGVGMLILAVAGFWPQYFSVVIGRAPEPATQHWLIHLHAALFVGWLTAYTAQAALVLRGRTRTHRRWGPWLSVYGFATAVVGVYAALLLAHRLGVRRNDFEAAAEFVFYPLIDMAYFAGFLAAALVWRRRPELHKRAMLLATFSIAVVGLGRLVGRLAIESPFVWQPLNLLPLLAVIGYDLWSDRKVYGVMLFGLAVHVFRLNADLYTSTEGWLPIGRALIALFR